MNKWFLSAELFSFIIILVLMLNFYERRWKDFPKRKIYNCCLLISAGAILLNIICVYLIGHVNLFPLWINILCNSAYFLLIVLVSSIIAYYIMYLLYEHIYQRKGLRIFKGVLVFLYAVFVVMILYNINSGIIFYFDENRAYHRGPLINSGYVIMGIQLLFLVAFTVRNVQSISNSMLRVMRMLPPSIILLTIYQLMFPDVLFNGGILVTANIILLVNFQNHRIEQDALTSSGNRNSFVQELQLKTGGLQWFQIIVVAIHKFGSVNQRYGDEKGDQLLYYIAKWLEKLHASGVSFRISNVEFALMVPFTGKEDADKLLEYVCRRFKEPWIIGDMDVILDSSFAEIICTDEKWNATDIIAFLNFSLSLADTKKNRVVRFDESAYKQMEYRNSIIKLIQDSVKRNRFQVWYQPIYQCNSGKFNMAEALIRMADEEGNMISPSVFIPLAEQHGLMREISKVVLENTCRLLADPASEKLGAISVNLSMQQFLSLEILNDIRRLMKRYHFDPTRLKLELTERVLAEDVPQMHHVMNELNKMGIRFSLDDFGTGYSNLSTVLSSSFACVKLDRSLIREYSKNGKQIPIVTALVDLFHEMGCQVVAEGVETEYQAIQLIRQGVDWIQGFYYAKPMPEEELLRLLKAE